VSQKPSQHVDKENAYINNYSNEENCRNLFILLYLG